MWGACLLRVWKLMRAQIWLNISCIIATANSDLQKDHIDNNYMTLHDQDFWVMDPQASSYSVLTLFLLHCDSNTIFTHIHPYSLILVLGRLSPHPISQAVAASPWLGGSPVALLDRAMESGIIRVAVKKMSGELLELEMKPDDLVSTLQRDLVAVALFAFLTGVVSLKVR